MLTTKLDSSTVELRPAQAVCSPADLGGARSTRHSFTRQLIREIGGGGWKLTRTRFDIDAAGRGTAVYEVQSPGHTMSLALFSQVIEDSRRTDRVIAEAWDVTGALMTGTLDTTQLDELRPQVMVQEEGRALPGTLIWGRANRSVRFFNETVALLARGEQPAPDMYGMSPYLLRSTAFYSNGKFGMRDFESYPEDHPLGVPYRAHMLAAWLFREFSYDLVEHCAQAINPNAARLEGAWSSYLGLGNATGLGLVPFAINHPEILDSWLWSREFPLAIALARPDAPESDAAAEVARLVAHFITYLSQQGEEVPTPFTSGAQLADAMRQLRTLVDEYVAHGTVQGAATDTPWVLIHEAAQQLGDEARGVFASIVTELTGEVDTQVQAALRQVEDRSVEPAMTVAELLHSVTTHYSWIDEFDFTTDVARDRFWFTSQNSEEPRRGITAADSGDTVQHGVDIASRVYELRAALQQADQHLTVAEFLLGFPEHRGAVSRVQRVGTLRYSELHVNLQSSDFLPLCPQRLQLAVYGMENYNPQSTDWLRVTLLSGAPRLAEVNAGTAGDNWMFPLRPGKETSSC